jgi:UDP-glucose 4-epimerase/UDP-glucuronate decarboxylase
VAERALITGGAGFVGLHLARRLLREGTEVTILDDFSRGRPDAELRELGRSATVVRHDLTAPIPPGLLPRSFDHVYHLAGLVGVRRTSERPDQVLEVNLRAAWHVVDWCRHRPPGAVFLSSTSEVADGATRLGLAAFPVGERVPFVLPDPALPRATYALSKAVAEAMFRHAGEHFRVRIGRYHNIYGPRMGNDHVIPHFIARALARRDPFAVYGPDQTRSFCHVSDAVRATIAVTRLAVDQPVVVNIGNDQDEIEIGQLAHRVTRLVGYHPAWQVLEPAAGSPDRRLPDLTILRRLVGYVPTISLDTGLRDTLAWYAANRPTVTDPHPVATTRRVR